MNRFEQEYYANINGIARALDRIADALENNSKKDENITAVTPTGDTIYYKTRRDMYMDNPCTKEEYEAHKANNMPGFEGTLDALDNLCNVGTNPKNDPERDKFEDDLLVRYKDKIKEFPKSDDQANEDAIESQNDIPCKIDGIKNDSDYDLRVTARIYTEELEAGNFKTKKDCILDYVTNVFGSYGARYTDVIKFAYYLGAPNAPKFNNSNRGYYACALTHGRWNTGHLVTGGKDCLVKGINSEGKERYFALSSVDSFTDYYKRLDQ